MTRSLVLILMSTLFGTCLAADHVTYLPHYTFSDGAWQTVISLHNPELLTHQVTVSAYSDQGVLQTETTWTLHPGETLQGQVNELIPNLTEERGWLALSSQSDALAGIMKFTAVAAGGSSSLPLTAKAGPKLVFPLMDQNAKWNTGFAVINPAETSLTMDIELVASDGRVLERKRETLSARSKRLTMMTDLFDGAIPETSTMRILADGDMLGFALTFAQDVSQIVAVPATPLPGGLPQTTPASQIRGTWEMLGYDRFLVVDDTGLSLFDGVPGPCTYQTAGVPLAFVDDQVDIQVRHDGSIDAQITNALFGFSLVPSDVVPETCTPSTDPVANFEAFWQLFQNHYVSFEERGVDWQSVYDQFAPQVSAETSGAELFDIFTKMAGLFKDGHVSIESVDNAFESGEIEWINMLREEFAAQTEINDFNTFLNGVINEWFGMIIADHTNGEFKQAADGQVIWSQMGGTGYLLIQGFSDFGPEDEAEGRVILEQAMAAAMRDLAQLDSIMIDIRLNPGGNDEASVVAANWFADQNRLAFSKRAKTIDGFTAFRSHWLTPREQPYDGKIVLLTSGLTASAAEVFTLQMSAMPGVVRMGEATNGVFSDTLDKVLPNGWEISLSNEVYLDHQGVNHEVVGIQPHVAFPFLSRQDRDQGKDSALEAALASLRE